MKEEGKPERKEFRGKEGEVQEIMGRKRTKGDGRDRGKEGEGRGGNKRREGRKQRG